jgi:hypothetical protein
MELTLEQLRSLKPHPLCAILNSGAERKPHKGRKGFDMTWEERSELQLSISRFGICGRIIIDTDTGEVLDGWNTLQCHWAAVEAGAAKPEDILPHIEYRTFASPTRTGPVHKGVYDRATRYIWTQPSKGSNGNSQLSGCRHSVAYR